ncbi:MAG: hypothetical protein FH753_06230 [Firmicutes bacterium]|nr:hypothetical protein [Bacillota bacterium]
MIEKVFNYSKEEKKNIEKIVNDDNLMLNHMVLPKDEGLPIHYSNSNVYMIIVKGKMNIKLDEKEANIYTKGDILNIPYKTKMNVKNKDEETLEFFVIKAPNPKDM